MLTHEQLVNVLLFMERAESKGHEARAWVQTYDAVQAEIEAIDRAAKNLKTQGEVM